MTQKYQPPEAKIQAVLERFTPREIAIAYLRQKHRADNSDMAFKVMCDLNDAEKYLEAGDGAAVVKKLETTMRSLRTHKQTGE